MELSRHFHPLPKEAYENSGQWGAISQYHTAAEEEFPSINNKKIALFSVEENPTPSQTSLSIRKYLSFLSPLSAERLAADLGIISPLPEKNETATGPAFFQRIAAIIEELYYRGIKPIMLSQGKDQAFSLAGRGSTFANQLRLSVLEPFPSFTDAAEEESRGLLNHYFEQELFGFAYLGFGIQEYLTQPAVKKALEAKGSEMFHAGELRSDLAWHEPWIRWSHGVSVDLSVVRSSDSPYGAFSSPAGLHSEELCQLIWYAGMNENNRFLSFHNWREAEDSENPSAFLTAMAIWYFLKGVSQLPGEDPLQSPEKFYHYMVNFDKQGSTQKFFKSKTTNRWWMSHLLNINDQVNITEVFPCSYRDYQMAAYKEIPDRYWRMILN